MTGAVVYNSRYGATASYAEWIGAELNIPVYNQSDLNPVKLEQYDYFVLGGSVYIGKMKIASWIRRNKRMLLGKKLFLFIVCATPADELEKLNQIFEQNFDTETRNVIQPFFLRGRMQIRKLSAFDRFVLKLGARLQKDPDERRKMLTDFDEVKKENLRSMLTAIKAAISTEAINKEGSLIYQSSE
jgi:menaquinone-dependent protoporphyrinogen IX oxidase